MNFPNNSTLLKNLSSRKKHQAKFWEEKYILTSTNIVFSKPNLWSKSLHENSPYSELFCPAFSGIRTRITLNRDTFYTVNFWMSACWVQSMISILRYNSNSNSFRSANSKMKPAKKIRSRQNAYIHVQNKFTHNHNNMKNK